MCAYIKIFFLFFDIRKIREMVTSYIKKSYCGVITGFVSPTRPIEQLKVKSC